MQLSRLGVAYMMGVCGGLVAIARFVIEVYGIEGSLLRLDVHHPFVGRRSGKIIGLLDTGAIQLSYRFQMS